MSTITRKVKLRIHQGWSDAITPYLNEKPYGEYRVAEYEEGAWETEDLMEAYVGHLNPSEQEGARYVYEHAVMSAEEIDEWTTMSGTTESGIE